MLRIGICDDEESMVQELNELAASFGRECSVDTYTSGESLLGCQKTYDILFLDIDMKGINGINTAQAIRRNDKKVKIIYITSYADYIQSAFSVHAFAYLLKPVTRELLHQQLQEVLSYVEPIQIIESLRFETQDGTILMDVRDIYYFEYVGRKVVMVTRRGNHVMNAKITSVAEKMKSYGFYMPHKSFTVNLYYVKNIKKYDVHMMNEMIIPLSQKKAVEFKKALSAYAVTQI